MKITEENYKVIDRAEKLLFTDYGNKYGFIDDVDLIQMIDDLCGEIDRLQEELEDQKEEYEETIRDCYKPISPYEFYGVSEHDFH